MTNLTTKTITQQKVGGTHVYKEEVVAANTVDRTTYRLSKIRQALWFIGHLLFILLALRFSFLLLGARNIGIVAFIYDITDILVAPYKGVFQPARLESSFFDPASLLGITMYYFLIYLIDQAILLSSKRTVQSVL